MGMGQLRDGVKLAIPIMTIGAPTFSTQVNAQVRTAKLNIFCSLLARGGVTVSHSAGFIPPAPRTGTRAHGHAAAGRGVSRSRDCRDSRTRPSVQYGR
eukprot:6703298-Prymnesium_polylepis.1